MPSNVEEVDFDYYYEMGLYPCGCCTCCGCTCDDPYIYEEED